MDGRATSPHISRRAGLAALLAAPLAGCSAAGVLNAFVSRDSYRGREGVPYAQHPRQKLDIYLPLDASRPRALVVFFYGGGWTRGERADYRFVGEALAAGGAAAIVADYRLSPEVRYPVFLEDCALAVKWAFDNVLPLAVDPDRIHLMGHSAGAYNAAMLALDGRWLKAVGLVPRQLAGWIGVAGPYDFLPIRNPDAQVAFNWPATAPDTQPLAHVSPIAPPTLLVAAREDDTVNPQRSTVGLATALRKVGVPVRHKLYDRVGHTTVLAAMAGPLDWLAPVRADVLAFLEPAAVPVRAWLDRAAPAQAGRTGAPGSTG
jgi:acetyl esterase/lipase